MKKVVLISSLMFTGICLIACQPQKKVEPVQTVDWYMEHEAERLAKLKECENNPGELEETPNCENANSARRKKEREAAEEKFKQLQKKRKPLQPEDFKKNR